MAPGALLVGVDGCGVSVFGLPLRAMALGYARFASASSAGDVRERALGRIREAMLEWPMTTGGQERFSSQLMKATDGTLVSKGGAEGLECLGVPARGLGIALKCEDGMNRGVAPAVVTLLDHLGLLTAGQAERLDAWRVPTVRNAAGHVVGEIRARIDVRDAVTS